MKIQAVTVTRNGGPEVLALEERELGDPGPGQVRVRVRASGVNYIDVYFRTGLYPRPVPYVAGLEGAGVIPRDYDPLVDSVDFEQVKRLMHAISQKVIADVAAAPTHDSFFAAANAKLAGARKAAAAASSTG